MKLSRWYENDITLQFPEKFLCEYSKMFILLFLIILLVYLLPSYPKPVVIENFLTETELDIKYNIAETTAIAYDNKNNYVLIGYKKNGSADEGGILRITPSPDFKLIDNLDLEGVPQTIFVK